MGYTAHDAIVVTSFRKSDAERARAKAVEVGLPVSDLVGSPMNGWQSFLIAPDGSKEGWPDSNEGDERRGLWLAWARDAQNEDVWIHFVGVKYGGDMECAPYVTAASHNEDALTSNPRADQAAPPSGAPPDPSR